MKMTWPPSNNTTPKSDTTKHYHIFVGDLSPDIETTQLRDAFTAFGEVSDCRVVRDPQTLKSKGYGFVSFVKKQDAETAITAMNGQWLGSRTIRTNWATRKPLSLQRNGQEGIDSNGMMKQPLTFDDVYNQSSPSNCTVYCGGLTQGVAEDLIQKTFAPFGQIQEIRVFKDKGYAFIRFSTKESATHAIVATHNTEINGQTVKCSWGKEAGDPNNQQQSQSVAAFSYPFQPMGYWYPQGYSPASIQGQFIQAAGIQYPYGQYYGQGFNVATGLQMASAWPQPATATAAANPVTAAAAAAHMAALASAAHSPPPTAAALQAAPQPTHTQAALMAAPYHLQQYQAQ